MGWAGPGKGDFYIAFNSVWIHNLCGAESVVEDRTSWSLADLREAFDRMPEEFIRQILLPTSGKPQMNPKNIPYTGGIPVNRIDYEYMMDFLQREDRYFCYYAPGCLDVECPIPTAEQIRRFNDFFNRIDKFILSDLTLYDIVMDAAAPYFADGLSIEETIQRIENRVGLYVNENM